MKDLTHDLTLDLKVIIEIRKLRSGGYIPDAPKKDYLQVSDLNSNPRS